MALTAMTPKMTKQLNCIAEKYRKPYTDFVDELSKIYDDETGFWWDTPLASRNVYLCQCFLDICTLRLMLEELSQNNLEEVLVGNDVLRNAVLSNEYRDEFHVSKRGVQNVKAFLRRSSLIRSEYSFYRFRKKIHSVQNYRHNQSLVAFQGQEITVVGTYRVSAETNAGTLRDRYYPGLKENSDEGIVFLSSFGGMQKGEMEMVDIIHDQGDHICIEDWIDVQDFNEIRKYIHWCRSIKVQPCSFDGMDVTAIVKAALRAGSWDDNAFFGIARGNAFCRIVEQWGLKIKSLIDWYEGQPSSNAMIRRFRAKFPNVPTVAYVWTPCGENNLGQYPSNRQIEEKIVPDYYAIQGVAWTNTIRQFAEQVKCIVAPSFRHQAVFQDVIEGQEKRQGLLVVLSYLQEQSAQLLEALGEALSMLEESAVGPIYIKNHPMNEHMKIIDYGVSEEGFHKHRVLYLRCSMQEALAGKKMALLSMTSSTLEVMLSGCYTMNFIPAGNLTAVYLPKNAERDCEIVYSAEDILNCIFRQETGLSKEKANSLREAAFTRTNRKTVSAFLNSM